MNNQVLRHLFTGFVRLHILYHADKEPICGVEIMEELRRHGYDLGPGTLYPILHHLQEGGYLSRKKSIFNGKRRNNFRITASGKKLLSAPASNFASSSRRCSRTATNAHRKNKLSRGRRHPRPANVRAADTVELIGSERRTKQPGTVPILRRAPSAGWSRSKMGLSPSPRLFC